MKFFNTKGVTSTVINKTISSIGFGTRSVSMCSVSGAGTHLLDSRFSIYIDRAPSDLVSFTSTMILTMGPGVFPALLPSVSGGLHRGGDLIISVTTKGAARFVRGLLKFGTPVVEVVPGVGTAILRTVDTCYYDRSMASSRGRFIGGLYSSFNGIVPLSRDCFPLFYSVTKYTPTCTCVFVSSLTESTIGGNVGGSITLRVTTRAILNDTGGVLRDSRRP